MYAYWNGENYTWNEAEKYTHVYFITYKSGPFDRAMVKVIQANFKLIACGEVRKQYS